MTIKQLQELYFIHTSTDDDIDRSIKMVAAVKGITPDKVDDMDKIKFNNLCAKISAQFNRIAKQQFFGKPKKIVFVNGHFYRLHYRIDRRPMDAGKYVEAVTFGKDIIPNLHKIMATIAEPVTWAGKSRKRSHVDIAADMEKLNFDTAYHSAVFFYLLFSESMRIIQPSLVDQLVKKGMDKTAAKKTLQDSQQILDGFIMPRWSQTLKQYLWNRFGRSELYSS